MHLYSRFTILAGLLLIVIVISQPASAMGQGSPFHADSAYDLINAVNTLRASNGLSPYSINSILMYTAQNQADFMAANQIVTHSGPGGISLTDRMLAAGYPLAGDLSLGGFRAENIISGGEGMTAQSAINDWTGDAPHLNTMLSPNLTEIGAGVAINDGRVYYVIDAARPTTSGAPQAVTPVTGGGGTTVPAGEAVVSIVIINTPNSEGEVIHEVLFGQTLWQIAISYDVKIDEIKRLNNLTSDAIYPGEKLIIKKIVTLGTETPTQMASETATATQIVMTSSATQMVIPSLTATFLPVPPVSEPVNSQSIMGVVIGILVLALLAGVFFSRGSAKERQ